jgi:hypothetical protein
VLLARQERAKNQSQSSKSTNQSQKKSIETPNKKSMVHRIKRSEILAATSLSQVSDADDDDTNLDVAAEKISKDNLNVTSKASKVRSNCQDDAIEASQDVDDSDDNDDGDDEYGPDEETSESSGSDTDEESYVDENEQNESTKNISKKRKRVDATKKKNEEEKTKTIKKQKIENPEFLLYLLIIGAIIKFGCTNATETTIINRYNVYYPNYSYCVKRYSVRH